MNGMQILDVGGRKAVPVIRQVEASECGLACLAMIADFHGLAIDLSVLRRKFAVGLRGATMKSLMKTAATLGFETRALRLRLSELGDMRMPTILHWDLNHYVVLTKVRKLYDGSRFYINDPATGERVLTAGEISRHFTGVALELSPSSSFRPYQMRSRIQLSQLWSGTSGGAGAFASILALSGIMQLIMLISPFFLQLGMDTVLPSADKDLLKVLAFGFGGLVAVNALTTWMRQLFLLSLSTAFSFQVASNLCRHLLRLPLSWFERRHVGDVVSRFSSIQPITDFVSQGLIASVVDGVLAIITLIFMFCYSPLLAAVALSATILYCGLKLLSLMSLKKANVSSITAAAKENSTFIEMVRGVSTVKAFSRETGRFGLWQTLKATTVNAQLKLGRITATFEAAQGAVIAGERVLFVYFAVALAMRGSLTVGMVFAFQAYRDQFVGSATRLADQMIKYRLIEVHLSRISDIALSPTEVTGTRTISYDFESIQGSVELSGLSFRYGISDPFILRNIDLKIAQGEMLAVIGVSGGGKTTLLKIIMGLIEPTLGSVLIDGQLMSSIGASVVRSHVGSVLQEDRLFSGTLTENISWFDTDVDIDKVRYVCRMAAVLDEIEAMPLGLDTLVGDMGSSLSGGQRQRVLLARALYGEPSILIMDEGTANLDPKSEALIVHNLKGMSMTRIISTHRPALLSAASRIVHVADGGVMEISIRKPDEERPGTEP